MFTEIFKTDNTPKPKHLLCRGKRGTFKVLKLSSVFYKHLINYCMLTQQAGRASYKGVVN